MASLVPGKVRDVVAVVGTPPAWGLEPIPDVVVRSGLGHGTGCCLSMATLVGSRADVLTVGDVHGLVLLDEGAPPALDTRSGEVDEALLVIADCVRAALFHGLDLGEQLPTD